MNKKINLKNILLEIIIILLLALLGIILYFYLVKIKIGVYNYKLYSKEIYVNKFSDIRKNDLNQFLSLEKVVFENPIEKNEYENFITTYPNIEIEAIIKENVYGKTFLNNTSYLDLSDVKIDSNITNYFSLFPNLEKIKINYTDLTLEQISSLVLNYSNIIFDIDVPINGKIYNSLEENIDLSNESINDLESFKLKLTIFRNLKTLDMSNTNLSNKTLGSLREQFPNTKIDWILHHSVWSWRTDAKAFSVLITNFSYVPFESEDLELFKYCTDLQALDLGHQQITDISAIGKYLPQLRVLILADNDITDISPLTNLTHLHYLELFLNNISDITPLSELHELVDLNIANNYKLSDISILENKTELERLWINRCNISKKDYDNIIQKLPNTNISIIGMGSTDFGWRTHERYYKMISMFKNNYIDDVFTKYDK